MCDSEVFLDTRQKLFSHQPPVQHYTVSLPQRNTVNREVFIPTLLSMTHFGGVASLFSYLLFYIEHPALQILKQDVFSLH